MLSEGSHTPTAAFLAITPHFLAPVQPPRCGSLGPLLPGLGLPCQSHTWPCQTLPMAQAGSAARPQPKQPQPGPVAQGDSDSDPLPTSPAARTPSSPSSARRRSTWGRTKTLSYFGAPPVFLSRADPMEASRDAERERRTLLPPCPQHPAWPGDPAQVAESGFLVIKF